MITQHNTNVHARTFILLENNSEIRQYYNKNNFNKIDVIQLQF